LKIKQEILRIFTEFAAMSHAFCRNFAFQ